MLSINNNLSSIITKNSLSKSTQQLNQAIERMTTGFKINGAKDNAANFGIVTEMSTKLSAYSIAEDNASIGLDLVTTACDSLELIENNISRLRMLQEQALNGTYGEESLLAINNECNAIVDEIERLYLNTEFNGINLFLEKSDDGQILQEVYANEATKLEDLGITNSSFTIFDKNNNALDNYTIEGSNTIGDLFDTLKDYGFSTSISFGVISITSKDGLYISGGVADGLGITNKTTQVVTSTSQTSSMPVSSEKVTSSTHEEEVFTTTTSQRTEVVTIESTATTSIEQTGTIEIVNTIASSQTSSEKLQYRTVKTTETMTYTPDMTAEIGPITITEFEAEFEGGWSLYFKTITITPTTCSTIADIDNLVKQYAAADPTMSYYGPICLEDNPKVYFGTGLNEIAFFDENGKRYTGFANASTGRTVTTTTTTTTTATASSKLSALGITSDQYITINNNGTQVVVTCKSSATLNNIKTNLNNNGITLSVSGGKVTITGSDTAYIEGMSSSLASALKMSGDFYTLTTTTTTGTQTIFQTTTTTTTQTNTIEETTTTSEMKTVTTFVTTTSAATATSTFQELGKNSDFKITINSDGTKSVINIDKNMTLQDLFDKLDEKGIEAGLTDGKIIINTSGNTSISSSELNTILNLAPPQQVIENRNVNPKSDTITYKKNILDELGGNIYAPGEVTLQVGIHSDENSQITVQTAFSLIGYSNFRNIGADDKSRLEEIDACLDILSKRSTEFGAIQNRLESVLEEIHIQYNNLVSSRSTLQDADIAEVSSEYIRQQILQQASATLLSTANQSPAIALQLL